MKLSLSFYAAAAILTVLVGCSAPNEVTQPTTLADIKGVALAQDTAAAKFFEFSSQTGGNYRQAIVLVADWLKSQPNVKTVSTLDSTFIEIELTSGMKTGFYFNEFGADTLSLTRGGASGSAIEELLGTHSKYTIKNKKVLIYAACGKDFYRAGQLAKMKDALLKAGLDLDVTLLEDQQCTYSAINHFLDYGLVIIETHGNPQGFKVGSTELDFSKQFAEYPIVSEDEFKTFIDKYEGEGTYDKLAAGRLELLAGVNVSHYQFQIEKFLPKVRRGIWVTSKYLESVPLMPNTVVFGNMCYSGFTAPLTDGATPIATAFLAKKPIAYYGYAQPSGQSVIISNEFCREMDDSLLYSLTTDLDSTGNAHLRSDGRFFYETNQQQPGALPYLKQFGENNYSYEQDCPATMTDSRDGHVYRTVCIGGQRWMAENLTFDAPGSFCDDNTTNYCGIYGRAYTWSAVMFGAAPSDSIPSGVRGLCPQGWHLPSQKEYERLITFLGGSAVAGTKLKDTSALWPQAFYQSNSSGFSALPGGLEDGGYFNGVGDRGWFWTSSRNDNGNGTLLYLVGNGMSTAFLGAGHETTAASCRCLQDP